MAELHVSAGSPLQTVLDQSQGGDVILLEPGVRYVGTFVLPPKPAGAVITIRSSAVLPERRIGPDDRMLLPVLFSGSPDPALVIHDTANWAIVGVEFQSNVLGHGQVIDIQNGRHITLDRVLLVAGSEGQKRGILGNGQHITLTRSYLANIWRVGQESQGFCAWNGAGPYTLTDNYIEASGENVMFGGDTSDSLEDIPADILVDGNLLVKRLEWKGTGIVVKNLLELKQAKRVVIRGNALRNNWGGQGQPGYGIVLTPRNDSGLSPWACVEDVLIAGNVLTSQRGFNILGSDSYQPSGRLTRVVIRANGIHCEERVLQVGAEVGELVYIDNQSVNTEVLLYEGDAWPASEGLAQARPARYAVEKFTFYGNSATKLSFDGSIPGRDNLETMVKQFITDPNVPPPPPSDPPPPAGPTIEEVQAQLTATQAQLTKTAADLALETAKGNKMREYLAAIPSTASAKAITAYLKAVPK